MFGSMGEVLEREAVSRYTEIQCQSSLIKGRPQNTDDSYPSVASINVWRGQIFGGARFFPLSGSSTQSSLALSSFSFTSK